MSRMSSRLADRTEDLTKILEKNRALKLELTQVKKAHRTVLNNLKAVAFKESVTYLKEKTIAVTNLLTNTHRKFVQQFMSHKKRT